MEEDDDDDEGVCVINDSDIGTIDNDCVGSSVGAGVAVDGSDGDSEDDVTASDGVIVG